MYHNVAHGGSTSSGDLAFSNAKSTTVILSQKSEPQENKTWKPPALRAPVLILTIAICWALIAVLEFLLWKSQRDNGLIFAPLIADLPLHDTFLYLYFPTILAVIFSIYWAWIDLETKRLEPYYQLSKENGALGKDSLLLQYPFSFIPLVPLKAFRDRHWPVFWASLAVVLVTWGLVPVQSGLFSVKTVTRTSEMTFSVSTSFMGAEDQGKNLSMEYAQSTYGIVALNESLPPYMTRSYTLAPFTPQYEQDDNSTQGTYTAPTTMYTLDLECEDASHKADGTEKKLYRSKNGCNATLGLTGNLTIGEYSDTSQVLAIKKYTGQYIGYHNWGLADYYLSSSCPKSENGTFFASFAKSKAKPEDPIQNVTAIFCHARYWRQEVSASIDILTKAPSSIAPIADRQSLEWNVFNTSNFESAMNSAANPVDVRVDGLPTRAMPKYWDLVAETDLSLTSGAGAPTMPMVGLAVATGTYPLEDYLDWQALSKAYADAYRLLFARAMVEVLGNDMKKSKMVTGQQQRRSEAVVLEPVFVHVVVGLLGVVSTATIALLVLSLTRERNLRTDPSTIASIMSLVADNQSLLSDFADLDCCEVEDVQQIIGQKRYKLINTEGKASVFEVRPSSLVAVEAQGFSSTNQRRNSPSSIAKPVRPLEFSLWVAIPFINLFVVLIVVLAILYRKAYTNGLPLPSTNSIVQNILENYIPTAIATLIEPMWILINRLLCMLQPLEELQNCNAQAKKSVDANYNSLPPQLVIFQAIKARHLNLAAVCAMALLANILAIAFSGLFNQRLVEVQYTTMLQPPFDLRLVPINGSLGPSETSTFGTVNASGAYHGGDGMDQFLIAESNFTRNTSLPSWTDNSMFYLPLFSEATVTETNTTLFEAKTKAFGATLDCEQLEIGRNFEARISNMVPSVNLTLPRTFGNVRCTKRVPSALATIPKCVQGPSGVEFVFNLDARPNATRDEMNVCTGSVILGWVRGAEDLCPSGRNMTLSDKNTIFVHCRPRLITGSAAIRVDASGRLQQPARNVLLDGNITEHSQAVFSTDPINIIGQSNRYIFRYSSNTHNDSFATDMINHFAIRASNSRRLVDPTQPLPTLEEISEHINKAYSKLFAIWLGAYKKNLLMSSEKGSIDVTMGTRIELEQRIFLSSTMFIISEAILGIYVIVAIWVYACRPGRYLARLPTSIAAIMALFAASTAVQDMQGTSHLDSKGRAKHLRELNSRYGYGSFVGGGDGRVHIGIEKVPLVVKPRTKSTWLEQKIPLLRRGTGT
ncbi:hypothetical protein DE146DRAFT_7430 [Phaeosphaeria sp. MPI-PUGE-AT-0046c]|nr:hypothetical protein DE146DRAFT_7430 [Phaeosphaeria sp. MPI-PUGE-AT-0046c]